MSMYHDKNGNIRKELLDTEAEEIASKFVVRGKDQRVDETKSLTSAQLRRFYGDLKNLERKFEFRKQTMGEEEAFAALLPLVKMVKSKVAYASSKDKRKVPEAFAKWLKDHIDKIETYQEFEAFMLHFEAVVGFCYGQGMSN